MSNGRSLARPEASYVLCGYHTHHGLSCDTTTLARAPVKPDTTNPKGAQSGGSERASHGSPAGGGLLSLTCSGARATLMVLAGDGFRSQGRRR
jgi:hypothetical protein